ncbi:hypothetical protein V492_05393 [Pseudogymnoascus sp. VKM F-4246]|nr:hypothetical protein V492_05393 [Pseudogymnoascus sp. VKM F-4246]
MMLRQIAFWALFGIRHVAAEALTVNWQIRSNGGSLKANTQDSVLLDWRSDAATPFLRMLCRNETAGGDAVIISAFEVDTNGPFEYIMDSYVEPGTMKLPRLCFPELALDANGRNGVEFRYGIEWSLDESLPVKTVSQATDVPPETSTATSPSSTTAPNESSSQTTTDSPSQTTDPTSGTSQPSTPSTGGSAGGSAATSAPAVSTPLNTDSTGANPVGTNNVGVIVGGVIGGVAVLSFIIFAFFFLRRQKRNSKVSPTTTETSKWRASFFKREPKVPGPFFEKDSSGMARELEAKEMAREMEGSGMERELEANAGGYSAPYGGRGPVELPASPNYHP